MQESLLRGGKSEHRPRGATLTSENLENLPVNWLRHQSEQLGIAYRSQIDVKTSFEANRGGSVVNPPARGNGAWRKFQDWNRALAALAMLESV